ncbi:hypothetical protein M1146_04990 [Patescibacteria group bacterium]|nr:hypothetical protein [Patescibacteria group bacterium]
MKGEGMKGSTYLTNAYCLAALGSGKPWNPKAIAEAEKQLDNFVRILENEGIKVRRPDAMDHTSNLKVYTPSPRMLPS